MVTKQQIDSLRELDKLITESTANVDDSEIRKQIKAYILGSNKSLEELEKINKQVELAASKLKDLEAESLIITKRKRTNLAILYSAIAMLLVSVGWIAYIYYSTDFKDPRILNQIILEKEKENKNYVLNINSLIADYWISENKHAKQLGEINDLNAKQLSEINDLKARLVRAFKIIEENNSTINKLESNVTKSTNADDAKSSTDTPTSVPVPIIPTEPDVWAIGDNIEKVIKIQGTPTAVHKYFDNVHYQYGYSEIITDMDGIVKEYSNRDNNLKIDPKPYSGPPLIRNPIRDRLNRKRSEHR